MSKFKKVLSLLLVVAITAGVAITGTLAYLTSEDSDVNVMTLGNVKIEQLEYQRVQNDDGTYPMEVIDGSNSYKLEEFEQAKPLYPAVYPTNSENWDWEEDKWVQFAQVGANGGGMSVFTEPNAVDKFVFVKNTGKSDAYVRTLIAFECGSKTADEWSELVGMSNHFSWDDKETIGVITVDGSNYVVVEYVYKGRADKGYHANGVLPAGEVTQCSLGQVYMKSVATNEDVEALDGNDNGTYDILVLSQAVQTAGFSNAENALDAGFGDVTTENAAGWFKGVEFPLVISATAIEVTSNTSFDELAALLAEGKDIYVTESMTVEGPVSDGATRVTVGESADLYFADGAILTLKNTTVFNGTGTITVYNGSIETEKELCISGNSAMVFEGGEHSFAALSVASDGAIVVNDGILNCLGTYGGIEGICFGENGKLIVNDGKLNMYQPFNLNQNRCDSAYIEVNGGTIELLNGIENLFNVRNIMDKDKADGGTLRGSSIRVNGGTFIAHYEIDSAGDATSFIRNSDSPADTNKVLVSNEKDSYDCVVTGGLFYGSWQRADNTRYTSGNGANADGEMVYNSIAGFVAVGYQITGDATNGYVISAK